MSVLYNLFIYLLNAAIFVASFSSRKVCKMTRGRKETFGMISRTSLGNSGKVVWVHCASLGEFEQGRPIIEQIKRERPDTKIVLTFFSPSGYEVRKNYAQADLICYMPSDTPANVRKFVGAIKPDIAIFVKYEYWHNFLKELSRCGAKSYVVSAIFRPDMRFFKKYGGFFRKTLSYIDHFFVQNEESAKLLNSIGLGADMVSVTGDTRFDRVADIVNKAPRLLIVEQFAAGSKVVVCGSTWGSDIDIIVPLMNRHPDVKFIIAPHEIHESEIEHLIKTCGRTATRYTQKSTPQATLMVIDCIGILSGAYAYGDVAYVGGGFGVGIHNILEAATWGMPILFGPKYGKFAEAKELIELGGAFSVESAQQLEQKFQTILESHQSIAEITADYVKSHTGASKKILEVILKAD